jgi:DNA-binding transcriptional LysR family regulator
MTLMPYLSTYICNEAPGVGVRTLRIDGNDVFRLLDTQQAEYGIFPLSEIPDRFSSLPLGGDTFVCMMRGDHELARYKDELPLEEYAAARHLLVSPRGDARGFADEQLEEAGLKRRIVMTVNNFGGVPMIVLSSNMIVTIPSRMAEKCCKFFDMHIVPSPVQPRVTDGGMILFWHHRLNNHPAHTWFQGLMQRAAKDLQTYGMEHYLAYDQASQ